MQERYDVMQVCLNGHVITDSAVTFPQFAKPFCPDCGERTITACPDCNAPIQGALREVPFFHEKPAPNNCHHCGTAYPWRQAAIASAIEMLEMGLEGQNAAAVAGLVRDVATETPRTQLGPVRA